MIRSLTVYSNLTPWQDWEPVIREEMARLNIPYSERRNISFVILRPLSSKPRQKKPKKIKQKGLFS